MNLIFKNNIENSQLLEELYLKSFPKEERFPFWVLKECSKENNSDLLEIYDNDEFVGFCYVVKCDNLYYLMYFAVEPNLRNKGYGSIILKELANKYKNIFLSIEKPSDELTKRRKNFYLENGFIETNKIYEDTGVFYEVLCNNKRIKITEEIMMKRYTNMSSNSDILKNISDTFDTNVVEFINDNV